MKVLPGIALALGLTASAPAQDQFEFDPEALKSAVEWVDENIDEDALETLGVDRDRVERFLREIQKRLEGASVYDLASLRKSALDVLPVLQEFDETRPYAVWLRTRLDYLDVSEELRSKETTTQPSPSGPTPQRERSVWVTQVTNRPVPEAAEKYLSRLKATFVEEKVPAELVWVAEVESSFDPSARSPAGATGLFQLMPKTARSLDLSLWPRDERLQPEKGARAAARYLRQLYERFGDWQLALAAYNAGPGRVDGLLKKHSARSFDAISRYLPAETQMYVPKVEATVLKREGKSLDELKVRPG